MTPYLIITDEMTHALCLAAKRGVDVRIITPGIPDKKMIYNITRSFYHGLVKHGVRIYEWTPGFCHAKMSVADDCMATCGTINLDYRSLYHHFENGCFMADCQAVVVWTCLSATNPPPSPDTSWTRHRINTLSRIIRCLPMKHALIQTATPMMSAELP